MWKTVLLLLVTLILLPIAAFYMDDPLNDLQLEALMQVVWVYLIAAGAAFLISTITKNYSQVDKLWSTIPIVYAWLMCAKSDFEPRLILMAGLVTLWGVRLTYNFARRGGYSWKFWEGEEDYRWAILQQRKEFSNPVVWMIFNLFFISFYQMGLILLFTLPTVKSIGGGAIGIWDIVVATLFVVLVVIEYIADQQQYVYQTEKHRRIKAGEELTPFYEKGFTHKGLWAIVRHPNYASEQAIWIVFYFFSVIATGNWINWSMVGCLLLVLLFKGSSDFSEKVSAEKYSGYKDYQEKVPRFVPFTKF